MSLVIEIITEDTVSLACFEKCLLSFFTHYLLPTYTLQRPDGLTQAF